MQTRAISRKRSRVKYALAIVLVIGLGLLWRSGRLPLPAFLTKYGGDALWAVVVFLGVGFVFCPWSTARVAVVAACFSVAVECSQLYHAPWIEAMRANWLGRLVLGTTFQCADLLAYAVGIALGVSAERIRAVVRRRTRMP